MNYGAIDFETYYEKDSGYSLRSMGTWEYCSDPRFDAYLMAYTDDSGTWVGHPRDFDWERIRHDVTLLMHNANFDGVVLIYLVLRGVIPAWVADPVKWRVSVPIIDTADMTAYLRIKRDLASAAKYLLNEKLDKGPRDMMKGLHWEAPKPGEVELHASYIDDDDERAKLLAINPETGLPFLWKMPTAAQRETFLKYVAVDAQTCRRIFLQHGHRFPEQERRLSEWQRNAGWRGVCADVPHVKSCISKLKNVLFEAGKEIPWNWGPGTSNKTPLALALARKECLKCGIPAPISFAKTSPDLIRWEEEYSKEKYGTNLKWVGYLRDWRSANSYLKKFETILRRVRADGTVPYSMKYFSAHTGRPGASEDLNLLNLDSKAKFGCDIRKCFIARPGKVLCIMDQSQIEPRALDFLVGDTASLKLLAEGQDPYEVHARTTMGWTGGNLADAAAVDPAAKKIRQTSKGRKLMLNYGAGFRKFIATLTRYQMDPDTVFADPVTITDEMELRDWLIRAKQAEAQKEFDDYCEKAGDPAEMNTVVVGERVPKYPADVVAEALKMRRWWINGFKQVMDFRMKSPLITGFWQRCGQAAEISATRNEDMVLRLPGGRTLTYAKPFKRNGEIWTWPIRGEHPSKVYGGLLVENLVQSFAREIFSYGLLQLLDAGVDVLWTVYDEWVTEIDEMLLCTVETANKLAWLVSLVSKPPPYAPGLPLSVSQELSPYYKK